MVSNNASNRILVYFQLQTIISLYSLPLPWQKQVGDKHDKRREVDSWAA